MRPWLSARYLGVWRASRGYHWGRPVPVVHPIMATGRPIIFTVKVLFVTRWQITPPADAPSFDPIQTFEWCDNNILELIRLITWVFSQHECSLRLRVICVISECSQSENHWRSLEYTVLPSVTDLMLKREKNMAWNINSGEAAQGKTIRARWWFNYIQSVKSEVAKVCWYAPQIMDSYKCWF